MQRFDMRGLINFLAAIESIFTPMPSTHPASRTTRRVTAANNYNNSAILSAVNTRLTALNARLRRLDIRPAHTNNTDNARPWFYLNAEEFLALTENAKRDFIWALLASLAVNYRFETTDDLLQQSLAQLLYSSLFVVGTFPLTALIAHKIYGDKESYKNCAIYASIADVSCLSAILPWNYFAFLGQKLYENRGLSAAAVEYLPVIFPGPGMAEGTLQTLVTTGLLYWFAPGYKFNAVTFGMDLSPLGYIAGNTWLAAFNVMSQIAKESTGGLIASSAVVMLSVAAMNYFTDKAAVAISSAYTNSRESRAVSGRSLPTILGHTGSPLHANTTNTINKVTEVITSGVNSIKHYLGY